MIPLESTFQLFIVAFIIVILGNIMAEILFYKKCKQLGLIDKYPLWTGDRIRFFITARKKSKLPEYKRIRPYVHLKEALFILAILCFLLFIISVYNKMTDF